MFSGCIERDYGLSKRPVGKCVFVEQTFTDWFDVSLSSQIFSFAFPYFVFEPTGFILKSEETVFLFCVELDYGAPSYSKNIKNALFPVYTDILHE